ncbi:MAG: SpoIIE family protein phosphatase [Spirochaetes bacterium]|nr:SpoIIE family protein phosphatase [Spirochaetota bacterium]
MRRFFLPSFYFVSNLFSFGTAAALSALVASLLTFVYVMYYGYALNLPQLDELIIALLLIIQPTILFQGAFFGLFHKVRFSGLTRNIANMNRWITRGDKWTQVKIAENLNADEMRALFRTLCYLPRSNAIMSAIMLACIVAAATSYVYFRLHFSQTHLIQVAIISIIAAFLHAGFTALITELITGEMRSRIKRRMYERRVEFTEIPLARVSSKIIFFILILVATLFVSNFLVYQNVPFAVMVRFSFLAIVTSVIMAYMMFAIIIQSLKEIEAAAESLKRGENANLFPETLDIEFINVATGLISATEKIRDYQINLERKVEERTRELTQANAALEAKDKLIQMELDFASEIQKGIIPARIEEWNGLRFYGFYKPMEKVSGDYYDVFPTHGNRMGVLMADVSGHGVPAALITTMAKVAFARAAQNTASPAQTFREVNDQLLQIVTTQDYLTAFYLTIDETHHFYFGNASHQHAKIVRAETLTVESLDTDGLFVGAMREADTSYAEKESRLYAGDRLYLYTDGLIEIRNRENEELGNERFDVLLAAARDFAGEKAVPHIVEEVFRFAEGNKPNDDISILMVEVDPQYARFLQIANGAYQLIDQGNREDGARFLDEAMQLYDKHEKSLKTAGFVNYDLGHVEKAEGYLRKYIALNRQDAEVFYVLSSIAIQHQNFEQAEEYARDALNLRASYALAYNNLSIACLHLGKYALARFAIDKALAYEPENQEIKKNAERLSERLQQGD